MPSPWRAMFCIFFCMHDRETEVHGGLLCLLSKVTGNRKKMSMPLTFHPSISIHPVRALARFRLALLSSSDTRNVILSSWIHHFLLPKSGSSRLSTPLVLWSWKRPCCFLPHKWTFVFSSKIEELGIAKCASWASCIHFSPIWKLPKSKCKNSFWKTWAFQLWTYGHLSP